MGALKNTVEGETALNLNRSAWNSSAYEAWHQRYGSPAQAAAVIAKDPWHVLRRLRENLGRIEGRKICSLQGSHGRIAVAMALLGARVTVFDFSEANRRYALELASAAGVQIDYILTDVMAAPSLGFRHSFELVVLELGVLHYHSDLLAFFKMTGELLPSGGALLVNEYHPAERKLRTMVDQTGGDYFFSQIVRVPVAFAAINGEAATCLCRYWTLAEIVTAIIAAGYNLKSLAEYPDWQNPALPGTFTAFAELA